MSATSAALSECWLKRTRNTRGRDYCHTHDQTKHALEVVFVFQKRWSNMVPLVASVETKRIQHSCFEKIHPRAKQCEISTWKPPFPRSERPFLDRQQQLEVVCILILIVFIFIYYFFFFFVFQNNSWRLKKPQSSSSISQGRYLNAKMGRQLRRNYYVTIRTSTQKTVLLSRRSQTTQSTSDEGNDCLVYFWNTPTIWLCVCVCLSFHR